MRSHLPNFHLREGESIISSKSSNCETESVSLILVLSALTSAATESSIENYGHTKVIIFIQISTVVFAVGGHWYANFCVISKGIKLKLGRICLCLRSNQ